MIIRKMYRVESSHVVRNAHTKRCSKSIHGHSAKVEVFLTADKLDNAQMIMDFGLMKREVNDFIDSFDHTYMLWTKESVEFSDFIYKTSDRVIELPMSPSAEALSLMMLYVIDKIVKNYKFSNGEGNVKVHSIRYHETETGYAESFQDDLQMVDFTLSDIHFTNGIKREWKNPNWVDMLNSNIPFTFDTPEQQIC